MNWVGVEWRFYWKAIWLWHSRSSLGYRGSCDIPGAVPDPATPTTVFLLPVFTWPLVFLWFSFFLPTIARKYPNHEDLSLLLERFIKTSRKFFWSILLTCKKQSVSSSATGRASLDQLNRIFLASILRFWNCITLALNATEWFINNQGKVMLCGISPMETTWSAELELHLQYMALSGRNPRFTSEDCLGYILKSFLVLRSWILVHPLRNILLLTMNP